MESRFDQKKEKLVKSNKSISRENFFFILFRLKCPICEETFDEDDVRELEIHVDHHLATSLICPVCNLSFGMSNREAFERHVQVL